MSVHAGVLMNSEPSTKTRILFVDDSRLMQKAALKMLSAEFDVIVAEDGFDGWDKLDADTTIQLVFTDLTMPRCDGYEFLERIRNSAEPGLQNMPVLVVTGADNDEAARKKALDMGATDFITKPFTSVDMLARARAHAKYQRITRQLQAQVTIDALTGLSNKAGFVDRLQQDISYARRHQNELTLVKLEINEFRSIFLQRGKLQAEALIQHVAELLRTHIRKEDTAARIGLGGFALSFPAGKLDGIQGMVDRLRAEIIARPPEIQGQVLPIALSAAVIAPDVQSGISAEDALMQCEALLEEQGKSVQEPPAKLPVAVAVAKPDVAVAKPDVVVPVPSDEPVQIDLLLDQIKLGNTQAALKNMPRIINRLVPLLRLLTAGQRNQLIQFLQKFEQPGK
jgi:two-component system cell cycle response regulator